MPPMQHFDSDYAERLCARLQAIPADAEPLWGKLRRPGLIRHFVWSIKHAMGRSTAVPDCSTWFTRQVLKPLLLKRYVAIPRNVRLPEQLSRQGIETAEPGDLETLQALMEEYLRRIQDDDLVPYPHPFLGKLDIDEWDQLHVLHFEHHLRQFKV